MTEQLLQYIWKFRYFNAGSLVSAAGDVLSVIRQGTHNHNQGPDFLDAVIIIAGVRWAGTVEVHIRTSDWIRHRHQADGFYRNVILHVVWDHDGIVNDVPVLELKDRVPHHLLSRYVQLMGNESFIPCNANIQFLSALAWIGWKDRLLFERLERKGSLVELYTRINNGYWEESCWWLLARSFGLVVNAEVFEEIARSVPWKVIQRHRNNLTHLEALLLGQAGLLSSFQLSHVQDEYLHVLRREYKVIQMKYKLRPAQLRLRLLRMRPGNFPGLRLAQLASLLHHIPDLFHVFLYTSSLTEMKTKFRVTTSEYWCNHYLPGKLSVAAKKPLSMGMIDKLIINAVVPVLFIHGQHSKDTCFADRAIDWLMQLKQEHNSITDSFRRLGFMQHNAFDSQAMLELKHQYCDRRRCLHCAVGYSILNPRHPSQP